MFVVEDWWKSHLFRRFYLYSHIGWYSFLFGCVPYINHSVVRSPAFTQTCVHLALDVHKHYATSEAYSNYNELGPERPAEPVIAQFLRSSHDEHVQRPDDARQRDGVEHDGADHFATLDRAHWQPRPLKPTHERHQLRKAQLQIASTQQSEVSNVDQQ